MMKSTRRFINIIVAVVAVLVVFMGAVGEARVKLVTLPPRGATMINLDNPHYNLVMEERIVTLQRGPNVIDFSWQGVSIDSQSIQFEPLSHPDEVVVLSVSYPPNENALVWKVSSGFSGEEKIRIYYLLSGLDRNVSYRAKVNKDETSAVLKSYFRLMNRSGEDFDLAKIAIGYGETWEKSIDNGESKEMLSFKNEALPVKKVFIYEYDKDSKKTLMYYELENTEEYGLGEFMLKSGKARIFQTDNSGATIFLGEDWLKETPVNEKVELYLGVARDIVVERHVMKDQRINIRYASNRKSVVKYDRLVNLKYEIENFKDVPQELKIIVHIDDYWRVEECTEEYTRKNARDLEIVTQLPPKGEKKIINFAYRKINQIDR